MRYIPGTNRICKQELGLEELIQLYIALSKAEGTWKVRTGGDKEQTISFSILTLCTWL
jgi:hypothetical protein